MKPNVGTTDRNVRLAVGGLLAVVGLAVSLDVVEFNAIAGGLAVLVGAVLIGTALTNVCPLYRLVGIDTCSTR